MKSTGGFSGLGDIVACEMPDLMAICRQNQADREAAGRAGWSHEEWERFIAAARAPNSFAVKDGLFSRLLGSALVRTVYAVEQMKRDGFDAEKMRQVLVLRKQHEGGIIDARRVAMTKRHAPALRQRAERDV